MQAKSNTNVHYVFFYTQYAFHCLVKYNYTVVSIKLETREATCLILVRCRFLHGCLMFALRSCNTHTIKLQAGEVSASVLAMEFTFEDANQNFQPCSQADGGAAGCQSPYQVHTIDNKHRMKTHVQSSNSHLRRPQHSCCRTQSHVSSTSHSRACS